MSLTYITDPGYARFTFTGYNYYDPSKQYLDVVITFDQELDDWNIEIGGLPGWFQITRESTFNNQFLFRIINVQHNQGASRNYQIPITATNLSTGETQEILYTIVQDSSEGKQLDFNPYPNEFVFNIDGGTGTIYADTSSELGQNNNLDHFELISKPNWVDYQQATDYIASFTVSPNPAYSTRTGKIVVRGYATQGTEPSYIDQTIQLTQLGNAEISLGRQTITSDFHEQTLLNAYSLNNCENLVVVGSTPSWIKGINITSEEIQITVSKNTIGTTRKATIRLQASITGSGGETTSTSFTISQTPTNNIKVEGWLDTFFELTRDINPDGTINKDEEYISYRVEIIPGNGAAEEIYRGSAYFSDLDSIEVNLREIWEDYLSAKVENIILGGDTTRINSVYSAFQLRVYYSHDDFQTELESENQYTVFYDYTYSFQDHSGIVQLTNPIQSDLPWPVNFPLSFLAFDIDQNTVLAKIHEERGAWVVDETYQNTIPTQINNYFAVHNQSSPSTYGLGIIDPNLGEFTLTSDPITPNPIDWNFCCDWLLIYQNQNGGYDWFYPRGKVSITHKYKNNEYQVEYKNYTTDPGSINYLKEETTQYKASTGFLTEEQSSRMKEIFQSNRLLLVNLKTFASDPVKITDTSYEEKTSFRGNNRKLISFNINLESTQKQLIR